MTGRQPLRPATFERAAGGAGGGGALDTPGGPAPRLIGSDIGCGMRPLVFDGDAEAIAGATHNWRRGCNHVFFAGGRDLALSARAAGAALRRPVRAAWKRRRIRRDAAVGVP